MADARKLKDKVARHLSRQDYDAAHAACLELVRQAPGDDHALLKLGEIEERLGRTDAALGRYRTLVDRYADEGRLVRAIAVARRILDARPEDPAIQRKLALLYAARGLPPAAASGAAAEEARHAADHAPAGAGDAAGIALPPASEEMVLESAAQTLAGEIGAAPAAPSPPAAEAPSAPTSPGARVRPPSLATGQRLLDVLASEEDPFATSAEEARRRQLAAEDLESLDLGDLDLAFVELAGDEGPRAPATPLFSDLAPEELEAVLARVTVRRPAPGDAVVRQGETGDSVFVVAAGTLEVRVTRRDGTEAEVATLGEGDFFGEFGLFLGGRRQATVVAEAPDTELLEIRQPDLEAVAARHPRVREVLGDFYRRRAVDTALASSHLFGGLKGEVRDALARMVSVARHAPGSTVLQEGDDGDGLYLVRSGHLRVESRGLAEGPVALAELWPGDFFGEISLLSEVPVTADVVATEPTELLKLSRTEVLQLCEFFPELEKRLEATREHRLHASIERLSEAGVV